MMINDKLVHNKLHIHYKSKCNKKFIFKNN